MAKWIRSFAAKTGWHSSFRMEKQIKDYILGGMSLIWQRQATFLAATILSAYYFDPTVALFWYSLVLLSEFIDNTISRRILRHGKWTLADGRRFMMYLLGSTVISSVTICGFVISMATKAGPTAYFTPLFFLFAAGIFAAVNNHQILPVLLLRLLMYGLSFLYIPLHDLIGYWPPIDDILWLQLFTSLFVMYFVIDCSFIFLKLYRHNLRQLKNLQKEHERTKVAYKAKTEFLATVSHELRTPLTSISGSLSLISSGALDAAPEKRQAMLKIAESNCARLTFLIEDILTLQSLESDELTLSFEPLELGEFLHDVRDAMHDRVETAGMVLTVGQWPAGIHIHADQARLLQLMKNLVSNAVKFSDKGTTVTLSADITGGMARLAVTDQGIGIPPGAQAKIFEKFTQLDNSDQRKVGGAGLGLNIAQLIAEKHNGTLTYESTLGEGSTFYVSIPMTEKKPSVSPQDKEKPAASKRLRGAARRKAG